MDQFLESVLKPNELITADDAKVLLENKDKWNDEEKVRFESLTDAGFAQVQPEPEPEPTPTPQEEKKTDEENPEPTPTPEPAAPTGDEQRAIRGLGTKEEIDAYVEAKKKELAEAGVSKKDIEKKEDEIIQFWEYSTNEEGKFFIPKEKQPLDWNHAFTHMIKHIQEHPEILFGKTAPAIRDQIRQLDEADRQRLADHNQKYDEEMGELYKEKKIADPKSTEGRLVDYLVTRVGATYGMTSMKQAYDLWSKISPDQGGGYGYEPGKPLWEIKDQKIVPLTQPAAPTPAPAPTSPAQSQKSLAAKVGAGAGAPAPKAPAVVPNSELHNKSMDQLKQEAMAKHGL